jgi:hypothetical protein
MTKQGIRRFVSVLVGAAVMFGLELGLGIQFYIAIPAGILTYVVTLVATGLILKIETPAK